MSLKRRIRQHVQKNKRRTAFRAPRWLKPAAIAGGVIAAVALAAVIIIGSRQAPFVPLVTGAPAGVVDQTEFDYGVVRYGTPVETVFRVTNVSDQVLNILGEPHVEVREGCCPPRAEVSARTLWPGEEATVRLRFSMHEGMGGAHDFRVHLRTNDPANPEREITILSDWVA